MPLHRCRTAVGLPLRKEVIVAWYCSWNEARRWNMTHRGKTLFTSGPFLCPPPPTTDRWQASRCITLPQPVNSPAVQSFVHTDKRDLRELWEAAVVRPTLWEMSRNHWLDVLERARSSRSALWVGWHFSLFLFSSFLLSSPAICSSDSEALLSLCCSHHCYAATFKPMSCEVCASVPMHDK